MKRLLTIICLITAIAALQACSETSSGSEDMLAGYLIASESLGETGGESLTYPAFIASTKLGVLATPIYVYDDEVEYEISNPCLAFMPDGRMVIAEGNWGTEIEIAIESEESVEGCRVFSYVTTISVEGGNASFVEVAGEDEIVVGTGYGIYLVDMESGSYEVIAETANYDAVLNGSELYFTWAEIDFNTWESNGHVSSLNIDDDPVVITDLISGIPGASAGIAVDEAGNLYTGNGYANAGYTTGEIRSFDMENFPLGWDDGSVLGEVLSAGSLIWAGDGILIVGGGDYYGNGNINYFAALDTGSGELLWAIDPDEAGGSFYQLSGDPEQSMFAATVWDYTLGKGAIYLAY